MKILMVTSEANPLAKTGGLADVAYALSVQLAKMGEDVSLIMPYYSSCHNKLEREPEFLKELTINMSWRRLSCRVYKTIIEGVKYYLIENDQYFNRRTLYGFHDDNERFAFFTIASKDIIASLNLNPDIIHIHDWQAGMLPCLIEEQCKHIENYKNIKYVLTIHNPAFQGLFDPYFLGDYYGLSHQLYDSGKVRFKNCVSSLKTAIMYAHKITTVSPTHKEELLYTNVSQGLESVLQLRQDDFVGILNGIDYQEFNPATDERIACKYNRVNYRKNKEINKKALIEKLNLERNEAPLYGVVSRLTWQKGMDILLKAIEGILIRGSKVVILGSGEHEYEDRLESLRSRFPSKLAIYIGYNDDLAHEIYASCDFFLMPSLFEPCGISQMVALKYGTLPIVRITGGLKDTVVPYMDDNLLSADGFGFYDYSSDALYNTMDWAEKCYQDKKVMSTLCRNAMKKDNDWKNSAQAYLKLYEEIA